jgi:hypothetical protein
MLLQLILPTPAHANQIHPHQFALYRLCPALMEKILHPIHPNFLHLQNQSESNSLKKKDFLTILTFKFSSKRIL